MNKEIASVENIVKALEKRLYVTNITPLPEGYEILFSDGSQIIISDGKDGEDGKDAPVINVRLYEGQYYWTQTINGETDWLYDNEGNKVPASGVDATTPLLKVDSDGYWIISYDNGNTYARVFDENGNPVKAIGQDGEDGSSFFESVEVIGDELWLTLKDGSEIVLPIGKQSPYKAVDLGLSVKWASFNLGATVPEELGELYFGVIQRVKENLCLLRLLIWMIFAVQNMILFGKRGEEHGKCHLKMLGLSYTYLVNGQEL